MRFDCHYTTGNGRAHEYVHTYERFFGGPLVGTFNVVLDRPMPTTLRPCIEHDAEVHRRFWLVRLDDDHYAWAVRWDGSKMPWNRLELVSRAPLPSYLMREPFSVEILEPLTSVERERWIKEQTYWFQSFDWSPQRADSKLIWDTIAPHGDWSGKTVLDIGCANGAHCFLAARAGARVTGFEPDTPAREKARFINDYIESQDCRFVARDPGGTWDTILYLSVHHQWDETYDQLADKIQELRGRARDDVFVELIVPDLQQTRSQEWIDAQVGGEVLLKYRHKVRCVRKIYHIFGEALVP